MRLPRAASFRKPEAVMPPSGKAISAASASRRGASRVTNPMSACVTLAPRLGMVGPALEIGECLVVEGMEEPERSVSPVHPKPQRAA